MKYPRSLPWLFLSERETPLTRQAVNVRLAVRGRSSGGFGPTCSGTPVGLAGGSAPIAVVVQTATGSGACLTKRQRSGMVSSLSPLIGCESAGDTRDGYLPVRR
jgi:hypothetical protein